MKFFSSGFVFGFKKRFFPAVALFVSVAAATSFACRYTCPFFTGERITQAIMATNSLIELSPSVTPLYFPPMLTLKSTPDSSLKLAKASFTASPIKKTYIPPASFPTPPEKISQNIEIANQTSLSIDIDALTASPPDFLKEKPAVLIVHTHTTESYTPSSGYEYTPTDIDRTTDKKYNMVRVGEVAKKILTESGITVFHDTTINDYPSYNGSYNKSAANVKNHLKNNTDFKIVLDIHRDAIGSSTDKKTKFVCNINKRDAACIMLVTGSGESGLQHDTWRQNLSFSLLLQNHLSNLYPGLCRPLNFRKQRFNQHLAPGAVIVEVGTNGNTLDEALYASELFARGLADFLNTY